MEHNRLGHGGIYGTSLNNSRSSSGLIRLKMSSWITIPHEFREKFHINAAVDLISPHVYPIFINARFKVKYPPLSYASLIWIQINYR